MIRSQLHHRPANHARESAAEQDRLRLSRAFLDCEHLSQSARLLNRFSETAEYLVSRCSLPPDLSSCSFAETELVHRVFTFVTLLFKAAQLTDRSQGLDMSRSVVTCYRALLTYTAASFPQQRAAGTLAAIRQRYSFVDDLAREA